MPIEFNPAWEYWIPSNPEIAELLFESAKLKRFDGIFTDRGDTVPGFGFGYGNPNSRLTRLAPEKAIRGPQKERKKLVCLNCNQTFIPMKSKPRIYCSNYCYRVYQHANKITPSKIVKVRQYKLKQVIPKQVIPKRVIPKQVRVIIKKESICFKCDKTYIPKSGGRQKYKQHSFCSLTCKNKHQTLKKELKCLQCEITFLPRRQDRKLCSKQCAGLFNHNLRRNRELNVK